MHPQQALADDQKGTPLTTSQLRAFIKRDIVALSLNAAGPLAGLLGVGYAVHRRWDVLVAHLSASFALLASLWLIDNVLGAFSPLSAFLLLLFGGLYVALWIASIVSSGRQLLVRRRTAELGRTVEQHAAGHGTSRTSVEHEPGMGEGERRMNAALVANAVGPLVGLLGLGYAVLRDWTLFLAHMAAGLALAASFVIPALLPGTFATVGNELLAPSVLFFIIVMFGLLYLGLWIFSIVDVTMRHGRRA